MNQTSFCARKEHRTSVLGMLQERWIFRRKLIHLYTARVRPLLRKLVLKYTSRGTHSPRHERLATGYALQSKRERVTRDGTAERGTETRKAS